MAPVANILSNIETASVPTPHILSKSSVLPLLPSPLATTNNCKNVLPSSSSSFPLNSNSKNNFTIKTSKKWVLPPRPKPGRKPIDSEHSTTTTNNDNNKKQKSTSPSPPSLQSKKEQSLKPVVTPVTPAVVSSSPAEAQTPAPQQQSPPPKPQQPDTKPRSKRGRKSNVEKLKQAELTNNPIKQAIMKINEENYYLKLEVIKLVSDLKSLKHENALHQQQQAKNIKLEPKQEQEDISSVPMGYNSTSNKTNNNNTIYRVNSNSSTNLSTPLMTTNTSSSSPQTSATSPPTVQQHHGKKRAADGDINDLILSLIDLNHSNNVSPLTSNNLNSLHSEQIVDATVNNLKEKKEQTSQKQNFNCTNFLNLDYLEEDGKVISSSPNHDFCHDDNDSVDIDIDSLTPNSLLSLTKTNSTIDEIELDNNLHYHNHNHHFSPQLIDIPEIPTQNDTSKDTQQNYEFSFWKHDNEKLSNKNLVFNTNSTLDELIMERQREREQELLSYNEFNDLIDFDNDKNNSSNNEIIKKDDDLSNVIFNDDWRLDEDNLLNF